MISEELAEPKVVSQEDLCELHVVTLKILVNIIHHDFAPSDPDSVARKSYDYVMQNCREFKEKQGISENLYGVYFQNTKRSGLAISHYKKSMQLLPGSLYDDSVNEHNIAAAYADMGKFELMDFHRSRAIQSGNKYFNKRNSNNNSLTEASKYIEYKNILQQRLDDLSWSEDRTNNLSEMRRLWKEIEAINTKWISKPTRYLDYINSAQRFSSAEDFDFAHMLLNEAAHLAEKYPFHDTGMQKLDLQSARAKVLYEEGKYRESAALFEDWINRFQEVSGKTLSGNDFRLAGLAQEAARKYDLAIINLEKAVHSFETLRSSFEVRSRGQFLSGLIVTTYWGLIRSYAARYLEEGKEEDYKNALRAESMLRARQLGELIGIDGREWAEPDISALRLQPDELLLDYVLTDKAIVVFTISSRGQDLFMLPYDSKTFNAGLKEIRSKIAVPGGPDKSINDLQDISKTILKPLEGKLSGVKRLIVMPDGYLNGIPFALLSRSLDQYYPLIYDHEVVLMPSLSYLIASRNSKEPVIYDKELFALADPSYGTRSVPEEHRDDTKVFYTRAVSDFNLFTPLPETRTEVENIAHLLTTGDKTLLTGDNASETNVKSQPLEGYRYLHFATHGVLGNQIPGINEPALVLAAEGPGQDGFLTLSEIETLKLNSELTVLSACDTGSGRYFTGEGVMGLSRGFIIAGSRSVLASLWPIDSQATVAFMTRFYQHLQEGRSKSESLRLTQLALMNNISHGDSSERGIVIADKLKLKAETSHPYYWASFVLIGE
ncbi:MAG: CHAT domain-containing protein [Nitrospirota bacterium]